MRSVERIPVRMLPLAVGTGEAVEPLCGDAQGVLLLVGDVGASLLAAGRWAAVRRLAPDAISQPAAHAAGCACCAGRAALAMSLSTLFRQRAMGELPWFRRVTLVLPAAAVQAARSLLLHDPLVAARFTPEGHEQKID